MNLFFSLWLLAQQQDLRLPSISVTNRSSAIHEKTRRNPKLPSAMNKYPCESNLFKEVSASFSTLSNGCSIRLHPKRSHPSERSEESRTTPPRRWGQGLSRHRARLQIETEGVFGIGKAEDRQKNSAEWGCFLLWGVGEGGFGDSLLESCVKSGSNQNDRWP